RDCRDGPAARPARIRTEARNYFYRAWWLRRGPVFATGQKVQWRGTRMSSGVRPKLASCSSSSSLSHARMLAWVVVSPNKPAHQARSGFQRSGRARGHASARKLNGHRQPPDLIAEEAHFRTRARASAGRKLDLIRLDDLDRSCGQDLNRRRPDVVCPWRPFARTGAHCFSFGATAWRVAKPMTKSPREMGVVAKAAGVRDLGGRLAFLQRRAAMQKGRGVGQTKRGNEFRAGPVARREQLLQVTQRDSCFGCDFAWAEIRIGKAALDDVADTRKQPLRMARDGKRIGRRKQRAEEVVDRKLHVGIGWGDRRSVAFVGIPNKVEEQMRGRRFAARMQAALRLASEMGQKQLARQLQTQPVRGAGKARRGVGCIEQCNIAHGELHGPVVLSHHRPAGDLKYRVVVVGADESNIPLRPLGPISIATEIHGRGAALDLELSRVQAAYGHGSHPPGKGGGVDDIRLFPAARSEKRCPRLEIQSRRSGKAGAAEYRRLRGRRRLGMTSAADIAAPGGTIQRAHERS